MKNSYCTGAAGVDVAAEAHAQMEANLISRAADSAAAAEARSSAAVRPSTSRGSCLAFIIIIIPASFSC